FVEIGTVTAKGQPGNQKPRIFRLPEQQALINRLGFNNDGADTIAERLRKVQKSGRWPGSCRIGINIGKSKVTPLGEATEDYLYSNELQEIIATCEQNEVAGIIATNTTLDHSSIPPAIYRGGGLSGAPLREKSTALVRSIATRSAIPVIASGGIFDAKSAREKFEAGAQLLQVYTGYIYRGPRLLREIMEALP